MVTPFTKPMKGGIKEFSFLIEEPLRNGLSPDERMPRNSGYAETLQNLRATPFCAVSPESFTLLDELPVVTWSDTGTPMLFRGEQGRWVAGQTQLYSASSSWALTPVGSAFTAGGVWQAVFFHEIPFFTNGTVFIFGTSGTQKTTPTVQALGKHENRLLLGGLAGSVFSSAVFLRVFQQWKDTLTGDRLAYTAQAWDTGWVLYGERGGGSSDVPFDPVLALLKCYTDDNQADLEGFLLSELERYNWGLCRLRYPGAVQAFHELADGPLCFGENGVARLTPDHNIYMDTRLHTVGIAGRGAVGGSLTECVFVDRNFDAWKVVPGAMPERLRLSAHLSNLTAAQITIAFDPTEQTYWIADKSSAYLLDSAGKLSGPMTVFPTSIARDSGAAYAVVRDTEEKVTNGGFDSGTGWTTPGNWSIGSGVLTGASAGGSTTQTVSITAGKTYRVRFKMTRTGGSIRIKLGTGAGTTRSATGFYDENIVAAGNTTLSIEAVSTFTGTVDNLSVTPVARAIVFRSLPMDIRERGSKLCTTLQITRENITSVQAGIDYRVDDSAAYAAGPTTQATQAGNVNPYPRRSFVDAKCVVTGEVTTGARLERIEFRYQAQDLTFRRGTKGVPEEVG